MWFLFIYTIRIRISIIYEATIDEYSLISNVKIITIWLHLILFQLSYTLGNFYTN